MNKLRRSNISNKQSNKRNFRTITFYLVVFFIVVMFYNFMQYTKYITTPTLDKSQALAYCSLNTKCLGYVTNIHSKNVPDARSVKIQDSNGNISWFNTDYDTAQDIWNLYK